MAGLVGAQRTELMEGIFGLRAHTSGKVWIKGEEVTIKQPRDAIRKSVALLTEDRRATGIMGVLSVADNISIASLDALRKGPIMLDNKKILDLVATNKEKMAIKVPSPKTQIKSLSGGNQQKVLIARWLANNPDVLILDEPTRGIDVGAKYEIYCIIAELAKQGKSIIMISSEMSEIIGMSNRVMVMCDGRITGFIDGKDATQENIMALATPVRDRTHRCGESVNKEAVYRGSYQKIEWQGCGQMVQQQRHYRDDAGRVPDRRHHASQLLLGHEHDQPVQERVHPLHHRTGYFRLPDHHRQRPVGRSSGWFCRLPGLHLCADRGRIR